MKAILINNIINKKKSEKLSDIISKNYPTIEIYKSKSFSQINEILNKALLKNPDLIISAGGDGTINSIINNLMKDHKNKLVKIKLSVIPCGKANDLAKELKIFKNINKYIKKILKGKYKKIDLIKVNKKYFITGGGFGLPAHIIKSKNKGSFLNFLKEELYLYFVLKSFLFGYEKIQSIKINNIKKDNLMLVSIMNQSFIGKRFFLNPEAKNDDGIINMCLIKDSNNIFKRFFRLNKVINKKHKNYKWSEFMKSKKFKIKFNKEYFFMADGELLERSKEFNFSIIPKAINFIC